MKKVLEQLIQLQNVDSRLLEIEEIKGGLPEKVRKMTQEKETLMTENCQHEQRIEDIDKELRILSAQTEDDNTSLERYKDQLYLVTTNKEYDALLNEIDSTKSRIGEAEVSILELEEEKTNCQENIKSISLKVEDIDKTLTSSQAELDEALSKTESEENELLKQREEFKKDIEPRYYASYNRLRAARDGHGIVHISRQACGNCFYRLPPQTIIEIKRRDRLISCPSCGIFLYYDPVEDEETV